MQKEKLKESTRASGTTSKFEGKVLADKLDLGALGHKGPATEEKQITEADHDFNSGVQVNLRYRSIGHGYSWLKKN